MLELALTYGIQMATQLFMAAAEKGNLEIVELLLASGAQASVTDNDGVMPLDLALDDGHDDCVSATVHKYGVQPSHKSAVGSKTIRNIPRE